MSSEAISQQRSPKKRIIGALVITAASLGAVGYLSSKTSNAVNISVTEGGAKAKKTRIAAAPLAGPSTSSGSEEEITPSLARHDRVAAGEATREKSGIEKLIDKKLDEGLPPGVYGEISANIGNISVSDSMEAIKKFPFQGLSEKSKPPFKDKFSRLAEIQRQLSEDGLNENETVSLMCGFAGVLDQLGTEKEIFEGDAGGETEEFFKYGLSYAQIAARRVIGGNYGNPLATKQQDVSKICNAVLFSRQ